jgi:hypothetical protein
VPDNPRPVAEKGAIALMFPAGLVGYFMRGDWAGTSVIIPGLMSGLFMAIIISIARPLPEERLWPWSAPAVVAMHIIGGATICLLGSVALPDIGTRPGLIPVLEWTRPTSLAIFTLVDFMTLAIVGRFNGKR